MKKLIYFSLFVMISCSVISCTKSKESPQTQDDRRKKGGIADDGI